MSAATGNRCGHDPRRPRLELSRPEPRGQQPWTIKTALERAAWLYHDRGLFPELGARKRSERLEAMVLVLRAIIRTADRLTWRSGRVLPDGTLTGFTMVTIAGWGGLAVVKRTDDRITSQRACRALWDLRDAGYVSLSQPIDRKADGARRGLAGIRQIRMKLFERLQMAPRVRRERAELWKHERSRRRVETIAERRRLRRLFGESKRARTLAQRTSEQLAHRLSTPTETPEQATERAARARLELARRLERGE